MKFRKHQHLRKAADFARVYAARCIVRGPHLTIFAMSNEFDYLRVGLSVSKKKHGNAVHRNRARRWIREAFRRLQDRLLAPAHIVFIARPSISKGCQLWVSRDLARALTRAGLLAPESP